MAQARPTLAFAAVAALMAAAVVALYAWLGDPGAIGNALADLPEPGLASGASAASMSEAQVYSQLERHLARQPADGRALVLKARLDMKAQRFELAAAGYQKALEASSRVARDAAVWVEYAKARGMLQGATLDGQPRQLVDMALSLDAANPQALDLAGSAAWERREFAAASHYWQRLLEQIPPQSVRHAEFDAAIGRAEQHARFSLPLPR